MESAPGECSAATAAELVERHLSLLRELVDETLRRVPSSVAAADLQAPAMSALVEASRSWDADRGDVFADVARTRIRAALVETLRAIDWSARGRRPRTAAAPALVDATRAAVAALSGDRRGAIEGYFVHHRSLPDLSDELELDLPDLVALRDEALGSLRRTLAPVLLSTA